MCFVISWLGLECASGAVSGAWLLGNAAHNALTATGAFEVFYDGQLVRVTRHSIA